MIITYSATEDIIIKTKTANIFLDSLVKINDYQVPGAGEYDVKGIQCIADYTERDLAYFLVAEELMITYLPRLDQKVIKMEDSSDTQILIIHLESDDKAHDIKSLVKALEPGFLMLIGAGLSDSLVTELNLPIQKSNTHKISATSVPAEGTILLLNE